MNTYTAGPWKIEHEQGDNPYIVADHGKKWDNPVICCLYEDVTPEDSVTLGPWLKANDNAAGNSQLIAAAPDLLEALIYARDEIAMRVEEDGGDAYSVEKACRKIDEAIAKAEGRKVKP